MHDELCFNVNSDEQAARISEIMSTCVKGLKVPFDVDTELGDDWAEASRQMLDSKWAKQTPNRASRLSRRMAALGDT